LDFSEEKLKTRINFCACGGDHCIDKPVESADCDSDFHLQETDNFEESQDKSIQYIINNSEIRSKTRFILSFLYKVRHNSQTGEN
jgi:hypothetical protein